MMKGCISDKPISDERASPFPSSIRKHHRHFWLIFVTSVVLVTMAMAGQRISKVRFGEHEDFARLVFELEGTVQVGDSRISSGRIWLPFPDTKTELPDTQFQEGTFRSVEFVKKGQDLRAEIEVAVGDFEINVFALTDPDRIVLDVFPGRPASALTASEKEEVEPTAGRPLLPSEDESVSTQGIGTGQEGGTDVEHSAGALNAGSESRETGSPETRPLGDGALEVEPSKVFSAGFNWAPVGLVALGLFLVGLLSVTCMKVLKKPEATLENEGVGEDFRRSVAEIDTLIKEEILSYERLKWRNQE